MSSYVSGGKTWSLPSDDTSQKISNPAGLFNVGLTIANIIGLHVSFSAVIVASVFIGPPEKSDYSHLLNANGGFETYSQLGALALQPHALLVLFLTLTFVVITVSFFELKGAFDGIKGKRNRIIAFSSALILYLGASVFVIAERGYVGQDLSDSLYSHKMETWMNDRYGFEPYKMPNMDELDNPDMLHPDNVDFPIRDVKLIKVDNAFHLFDAATNKELPTK